jgi:hypothetical protein
VSLKLLGTVLLIYNNPSSNAEVTGGAADDTTDEPQDFRRYIEEQGGTQPKTNNPLQ